MGVSKLTSKKKQSALNEDTKSNVILAVQENPFSSTIQLAIEN